MQVFMVTGAFLGFLLREHVCWAFLFRGFGPDLLKEKSGYLFFYTFALLMGEKGDVREFY